MKKGILVGILVVLLVGVCALSAWIGVVTYNRLAGSGFTLDLAGGNLAVQEAGGVEEGSFTVGTPAALVVENPSGNVTVTGGDGDEIRITARKKAWGATKARAEENLAAIVVSMDQSGNSVSVTVEGPELAAPPPGRRLPLEPGSLPVPGEARVERFLSSFIPRISAVVSYRVDLEISLPRQASVDVSGKLGNLELRSLEGDARLEGQFGDVLVDGVSGGSVVAASSNGRVEVRNIQAAGRDVTARSTFGDVVLGEVRADTVTARTQNGQVRAQDVEAAGLAGLHSEFGDVSLAQGQAGSLEAGTTNGGVHLEDTRVEGALEAESSFGDVALNGVAAGSLTLGTRNGRITLHDGSGRLVASSDFGDIEVQGMAGTQVSLQNRNGSITYQGSLGGGPHTFKSTFGDIHLALPAASALDVDLQTRFGSVRTAFAVTASGGMDDDQVTGTVNGGGESLTASTDNGNITLDIMETKEN